MNIFAHYPFVYEGLMYNPNLLEPFLDCQTLLVHYQESYMVSVDKLNMILANIPSLSTWSLEEIIFNIKLLPESLQEELGDLSSSVYNHQIYFNSFTSSQESFYPSPLINAIINKYQTMDNFFNEFISKALLILGSGYLWLVTNQEGQVELMATKNHETTINYNLFQILGIDLWEHAYFTKYHFDKETYIINFLKHLNWPYLSALYQESLKFSKVK